MFKLLGIMSLALEWEWQNQTAGQNINTSGNHTLRMYEWEQMTRAVSRDERRFESTSMRWRDLALFFKQVYVYEYAAWREEND